MSKNRVPEDQRTVILKVYLLDKMATIEACWDDAVGLSWLENAENQERVIGTEFEVIVISNGRSEKITPKIAKEIAIRWMKGQYISVNLQEGL